MFAIKIAETSGSAKEDKYLAGLGDQYNAAMRNTLTDLNGSEV